MSIHFEEEKYYSTFIAKEFILLDFQLHFGEVENQKGFRETFFFILSTIQNGHFDFEWRRGLHIVNQENLK